MKTDSIHQAPRRAVTWTAAFAAVLSTQVTLATWLRGPTDTPVDRLVQNLTKYVEEHPQDARGYFTLGRAHSLAFSAGVEGVLVDQGARTLPLLGPSGSPLGPKSSTQPASTEAQRRQHLVEGVRNLTKAIELDGAHAAFYLSLASLLESGADLAGTVACAPLVLNAGNASSQFKFQERIIAGLGSDPEKMNRAREWLQYVPPDHVDVAGDDENPRDTLVTQLLDTLPKSAGAQHDAIIETLRFDWSFQTTEAYLKAFLLAFSSDSHTDMQLRMEGVRRNAAYEAGSAYIRLVTARGPTEKEQVRIATVKAALEAFDRVPEAFGVTPMVFSLSPSQSIADLASPNTIASFDLDGSARPQRWSWIKPDTGILAWDPKHTGAISSGRQLFGSVSWWLFFDNGYQALDALDDNRDGELAGPELTGIVAWFDRNSNGISDPGEVVTLDSLGISGIACRATSTLEGCPANVSGLRLGDGRTLPTYDWIASPMRLENASSHQNLTRTAAR